jgi:hypothetical protein
LGNGSAIPRAAPVTTATRPSRFMRSLHAEDYDKFSIRESWF